MATVGDGGKDQKTVREIQARIRLLPSWLWFVLFCVFLGGTLRGCSLDAGFQELGAAAGNVVKGFRSVVAP